MRRLIVAVFIAAGLAAFAGAGVAAADPITCPPGQTSENVKGEGFVCVNNGGNTSNAAETKNPND